MRLLQFLLCSVLLFSGLSFGKGTDVKTFIPEKAKQYLPTLIKEQEAYMPGFFKPEYFPALVEHESCISLTHSRCWSPTAKLQTKRELGIGFFQFTKTFHPNGKIRFDTLTETAKRFSALKGLSWNNVASRPDLQLRAGVLLVKDNWNKFSIIKDKDVRLAFTDSAHNGGSKAVFDSRRICGLRKGCDPNKWFGHVEKTLPKSRKPLYAGRSAYDINTHHVKDVLITRMPKYKKLLGSKSPEPQITKSNVCK